VPSPGPYYGRVGNVLLSDLLGATLYYDPTERRIGDEGRLEALVDHLRAQGSRPYLIPGGASEHRLGGLGYLGCAAEIVRQAGELGPRVRLRRPLHRERQHPGRTPGRIRGARVEDARRRRLRR